MTTMNLKIDQLVEKSMATGVEQSMVIGAEKLVVTRASTKAGGVIPAKPRRGFALGTMHTQTKFSRLIFPIFDEEKCTSVKDFSNTM